ncbi:MAG: OmpA family protein [Azovibrio sp.]
MKRIYALLLAFIAIFALSACVSERVVLLPSPDGKPSAVVVHSGETEQVLDQPFETVALRGESQTTGVMDAQEVEERFGQVIAQMPTRPVSFTLYFLENSSELVPESRKELDLLRNELKDRPIAEILIIGHTDTVGGLQQNDALSLKRAIAVREELKEEGIDALVMDVAGRGKRELLVPTNDEVSEARNRRVEVRVR